MITSQFVNASKKKKRFTSKELRPSASIMHHSLVQTVTDLSSRCNVLFLVSMLISASQPASSSTSEPVMDSSVCRCARARTLSSCVCVLVCTSSRQQWAF